MPDYISNEILSSAMASGVWIFIIWLVLTIHHVLNGMKK